MARDFQHKLEDIVKILLLPAFFAYTGMRTEIGLVSGWQAWGFTALIILVATLGKFGGTFAAARFTGLDWRMSAALGILMNTRGLMELIVLNIGLEMGVISPTLFAMMVIMALVTTMTTTPVLQRLSHRPAAGCVMKRLAATWLAGVEPLASCQLSPAAGALVDRSHAVVAA